MRRVLYLEGSKVRSEREGFLMYLGGLELGSDVVILGSALV